MSIDIVRLLFMVPIYSIVTLIAYIFYVSSPILPRTTVTFYT